MADRVDNTPTVPADPTPSARNAHQAIRNADTSERRGPTADELMPPMRSGEMAQLPEAASEEGAFRGLRSEAQGGPVRRGGLRAPP